MDAETIALSVRFGGLFFSFFGGGKIRWTFGEWAEDDYEQGVNKR